MKTLWTYGAMQVPSRAFKRLIQVTVLETLYRFCRTPLVFQLHRRLESSAGKRAYRSGSESAHAAHAVDLRARPKSAACNKRFALHSEQRCQSLHQVLQ